MLAYEIQYLITLQLLKAKIMTFYCLLLHKATTNEKEKCVAKKTKLKITISDM